MKVFYEVPCRHDEIDRHTHTDCQHRYKGLRVHSQCVCEGGTRTELHMAALMRAFDEAAAEAGVNWNPNLGPILQRARDLEEARR